MRCCQKTVCSNLCPWRLAWDAISRAKAMGAVCGSPLFISNKKGRTSKSGNINAWKELWGAQISGHSPRRSGAMYYVRAGLPIQELAFLGRWRSNVVLTYAEEALQEKAVEIPDEGKSVSNEDKAASEPCRVAPSTPMISAMACPSTPGPQDHGELSLAKALEKPRDLWVVTRGKGLKERPRHLVTRASWNLPISKWSTACGWFFAERSSDSLFVAGATSDKMKCSKCKIWSSTCATSQVAAEKRMKVRSK